MMTKVQLTPDCTQEKWKKKTKQNTPAFGSILGEGSQNVAVDQVGLSLLQAASLTMQFIAN